MGRLAGAGTLASSDGIRVAERVSVSPEKRGAGGDSGGFEKQGLTKSFLTCPLLWGKESRVPERGVFGWAVFAFLD